MNTPKSQNPEGKVESVWQFRYLLKDTDYWSGWAQAESEESARHVVARYAEHGFTAECRELIPATTHADMQRRLEAAEALLAQMDMDASNLDLIRWYRLAACDYGNALRTLLRDGKGDGVSTTEGEG